MYLCNQVITSQIKTKDISKSPRMPHISEYTIHLRQSSFSLTYQNSLVLPVLRLHIGDGNGTPLQYSCLENPMDGGAW